MLCCVPLSLVFLNFLQHYLVDVQLADCIATIDN